MPRPPIVLDTGTPLKCSRSRTYFAPSAIWMLPQASQKRRQRASIFNLRRRLTNPLPAETIEELHPLCGPVAQLGARFHGMEEVIGSIPIRSTNKSTT